MSEPVVLIGLDEQTRKLAVVGLYQDSAAATLAVRSGQVPKGLHYSVVTPKLGTSKPVDEVDLIGPVSFWDYQSRTATPIRG